MISIIFLIFLLFSDSQQAFAANCGSTTPCACGDTLVDNYTMTGNLTCAANQHGILFDVNSSGKVLDCNGFTISGPGWLTTNNNAYGVYGNGGVSSRINGLILQNCTITGFEVGARFKNSNNLIFISNTIHANGATSEGTNRGYGVELTQNTYDVTFFNNFIHSNDDEGVHNSATNNVVVVNGSYGDNVFTNNGVEDWYMLGCDNTFIEGATIDTIYNKNSNNGIYQGNVINERFTIIGNGENNEIINNDINGTFRVEVYDETTPFLVPNDTRVIGGSIDAAADCIRIISALNTVFTNVTIGPLCTVKLNCDTSLLGMNLGPASVTFIGSSFEPYTLENGCQISAGWNLDLTVEDSVTNNPIENVKVLIQNNISQILTVNYTDVAGMIPTQEIIVLSGEKGITLTPHFILTEKDGYYNKTTEMNFSSHETITIEMDRQ